MTSKERERAFLIGAPLAIVPALGFLPAMTFLIVFPRVAHGRAIGLMVLPVCALAGGLGLWKLASGAVQKPWGLFNVLNFGALLVLLVIAGYTGLFLALMTLEL
jgi:predicted tellurium resistance membrane protein TerC